MPVVPLCVATRAINVRRPGGTSAGAPTSRTQVVRGSAGLRAQRQLDVVALLVLAKGLRVALELVDRAVLVADGHHAVLLVHADDRAVDLLGRVALGRRRVAARRRGGLAVGLGLVLGERGPARE